MSSYPVRPFCLAERLRRGETVVCAWLGLPEPLIGEMLARENFDAMVLDMQHSSMDFADIRRGITAVSHMGKPSAVRFALEDYTNAARFLDMGAEAVIAPMINSVAEAKRFVAAVKYAPVGERSWGPARALPLSGMDMQSYLTSANATTLAFAMIETQMALDAVDEILAVPGIDGAFIGPGDLSVSLSKGKEIAATNDAVRQAMAKVMTACQKAGKIPGAYAASPAMAKEVIDKGWKLVSLCQDTHIVQAGAKAMLAAIGR